MPQKLSTLQPGLENKDAPSWLEEPIRHVVKSQQFNQEALDHVFKVGAAQDCAGQQGRPLAVRPRHLVTVA